MLVLAVTSNDTNHNIVFEHPEQSFRDVGSYDMRHKQGSPAMDAGSADSAPEIDIDGKSRPHRAGVDVGPHEFEDLTVRRTDSDSGTYD